MRLPGWASLGVVLVVALAGCSRPVTVAVPDPAPTGAAAQACAALLPRLPAQLEGQDRRDTEPASAGTAAWGDPPIVLRCGVPAPAGLTPTSELIEVNGVAWLPEQLSAGVAFTTVGRAAYVEVLVPQAYAPAANPLTDLASAVSGAVPLAPAT